jgi:hypothetical protein
LFGQRRRDGLTPGAAKKSLGQHFLLTPRC